MFAPKFHCELNPIEGLWCHQKDFVRKHSDQSFNTLLRLIPQSKENFLEKKIYLKLFRRFSNAMSAYEQGQSYAQVLNLFFSNLCSGTVISHRKITNSNLGHF